MKAENNIEMLRCSLQRECSGESTRRSRETSCGDCFLYVACSLWPVMHKRQRLTVASTLNTLYPSLRRIPFSEVTHSLWQDEGQESINSEWLVAANSGQLATQ
ncbi:uncharacterized protein G2W53_015384 [Senna tora]|uniref:Uncharacterized protein n=1 Tax=Senna tora TaxID=362788 RepID=A0A835C4M9_9FABA|nr:uncharacterized protein G2W53_015384 [Senna tora]